MPGHAPTRQHRSIPPWLIITVGAVATGVALVWSASLRGEDGERLIDTPTATVLVALLGTASTLLGLVLQRTGEVRHQVKNTHGTNLRDDIDDVRSEIAEVREIAEHAVRAARKSGHDTVQLREDVQALRTDMTGTASDIRGVRRDIGRITDLIAKERSP